MLIKILVGGRTQLLIKRLGRWGEDPVAYKNIREVGGTQLLIKILVGEGWRIQLLKNYWGRTQLLKKY